MGITLWAVNASLMFSGTLTIQITPIGAPATLIKPANRYVPMTFIIEDEKPWTP